MEVDEIVGGVVAKLFSSVGNEWGRIFAGLKVRYVGGLLEILCVLLIAWLLGMVVEMMQPKIPRRLMQAVGIARAAEIFMGMVLKP